MFLPLHYIPSIPLRHLNRHNHLPTPSLRVRLTSIGATPNVRGARLASNHASSFCFFTRRPLTLAAPSSVFKFSSLALPSFLKEPSNSEGASLNAYGPFFHSEREARELFERWCKKYYKTYSSEEQKLYRFGVFKENLECSTREPHMNVDAGVTLVEMCEPLNVIVNTPPEGVVSPINPNDYFHSETKARELFEIWCNKHGRPYSSEEEKLYRFSVFKETLDSCTRAYMHVYADLSSGEKEELLCGKHPGFPNGSAIVPSNGIFYSESEARELFENWCKGYERTYPSEDEKLYRFSVFRLQAKS